LDAWVGTAGTLGSGLTGSTTTSNFLFGRLQVTTAKDLGLVAPGANTVYEIAATNILGASAGEIIAPMNAIVVRHHLFRVLVVGLLIVCVFRVNECLCADHPHEGYRRE